MTRSTLLVCLILATTLETGAGGPCDTPPGAVDDVVRVGYDAIHLFDPAANDVDSDGDAFKLTSITEDTSCAGELTVDGPFARFVPDGTALPGGLTSCTATYTIRDDGGRTDSGTVTLVFPPSALFSDDFESGNTSAWDSAVQGN